MSDDPRVIEAEWEPVDEGGAEPPPRRPPPRRTFGDRIAEETSRLEQSATRALDEIDSFESAVRGVASATRTLFDRVRKDVRVNTGRPPVGR